MSQDRSTEILLAYAELYRAKSWRCANRSPLQKAYDRLARAYEVAASDIVVDAVTGGDDAPRHQAIIDYLRTATE